MQADDVERAIRTDESAAFCGSDRHFGSRLPCQPLKLESRPTDRPATRRWFEFDDRAKCSTKRRRRLHIAVLPRGGPNNVRSLLRTPLLWAGHPIGDVDAVSLESATLIDHVRSRRQKGQAQPRIAVPLPKNLLGLMSTLPAEIGAPESP
jgi:hypothetical protein